tara:strand:+ start:649 stop:903 length:255 start_codon:yes stop_codon:yes gene_type:complete
MTHIEMQDDYTQTTYYYGKANGKDFTVVCYYDSNADYWEIKEITWTNEDLSTLPLSKTEDKIRDFVNKWLFDKPKKEKEANGTV